jgi:hypothetical protein
MVDSDFTPTRHAPPSFDAKGNRIFAEEELHYYPVAKYHSFPKLIGWLMRRHDAEGDWCRGASGDDPETLHACNRRDLISIRIEELGYCWGSEKERAVGADMHWLKCTDQPNYDPQQEPINPQLFSDEEIADVASDLESCLASSAKIK